MAWEATAVGSRLRSRDDEARLLRAAATGSEQATAALIRRHEVRVFNIAFRITGDEEDAAEATRAAFLEAFAGLREGDLREDSFRAHLLAAATGASYDALERRQGEGAARVAAGSRNGPAGEPEDGLLLEDWQEEIRAASFRLPAPQRELLALGELGGISHDGIARLMEVPAESVPQLVAAARLALRDELRGTRLATEPTPFEDCDAAVVLMAMRDDSELPDDSDDAEWLVGHLVACRECRTRLDAMQDARLTYSAWDPAAPPGWVSAETVAAAAALPGQDGTRTEEEEPATAAAPPVASPPAAAGMAAAPAAAADMRSAGVDETERLPAPISTRERLLRRRRELLLSGAWGVVLMVGAIALLGGGVFGSAEGEDKPPDEALQPPAETRAPAEAARPARRAPAGKRDKEPEKPTQPQPVAPRPVAPAPVVVVPAPVAQQRTPPPRRRPVSEERRDDPPATAPAPRQPATERPPSEETPPAQPITPAPEPPTCTNPGGQPVPC